MWDPQWCRTAPLWTRGVLTQPEFTNIPHCHRLWPYGVSTGPLRSPHGVFMDCLRPLNLYRARKLIMHALKLYGPRCGSPNSYCAAVFEAYDFGQNTPCTGKINGTRVILGSSLSMKCDYQGYTVRSSIKRKLWWHNGIEEGSIEEILFYHLFFLFIVCSNELRSFTYKFNASWLRLWKNRAQ